MRQHRLLGIAILLTIVGCAPVSQSTAPEAESSGTEIPAAEAQAPVEGSERFAVVTANSAITILTFRAGTMARLGHNHAITSAGLTGSIWVAPDDADTTARIVLPVDSLVVDDPTARESLGPDFEAPVPDKDRDATRNNMLGEKLLNANEHSFVRANCSDVQTIDNNTTATCQFTVAETTVSLRIPIQIERTENLIQISGEVTLTHEQLGLTPFSAAGGAVRVADGMTVRYRIEAQRLSRSR